MGKKIIYILIIITLIFAGIFVAKKMSEENEVIPTGTNTLTNQINNSEKNEIEENKTIDSEVNEMENNVVEDETTNSFNPEEKAKQIVKANWGEDDDTVYYSYDGINEQGKYVICVRDKATTKALYRYYVDVETETCEIE